MSETRESNGIYRQEALDFHASGQVGGGEALQLSPIWIGWAYRLLMLFAATGLLFMIFGRMSEYATGPAIIRARNTTDITCSLSGVVTRVWAAPGQAVREGDVLVSLEDLDARDAVRRHEREMQALVGEYLLDPDDDAVRRSIASVRSQLDHARLRLDARRITAPLDGIVGDVRTRPGQQLQPGQTALTLFEADDDLVLVAVLPGRYKPRLSPGQDARLEISGYARAFQSVTVSHVAQEIIGPLEAARSLGGDIADAFPLVGPVLIVEAHLDSGSFRMDGEIYAYTDGLHGTLQVKVGSEPIVFKMLPGLRALGRGD